MIVIPIEVYTTRRLLLRTITHPVAICLIASVQRAISVGVNIDKWTCWFITFDIDEAYCHLTVTVRLVIDIIKLLWNS